MNALHHASIPTRDVDRSYSFYRDALGLEGIIRPPFKNRGRWLAIGDRQLHLIKNPHASFRSKSTIDNNDWHFAVQVEDFENAITRLIRYGFREDAADGDPMGIKVVRTGPAGFPQAYFLDPDFNVVEINAAT